MQPSKYQQEIVKWLLEGNGNACCNAVAGSGKSTTLKLAAKALQENGVSPSYIKIIVFGKANSLDLAKKFGSEWKKSISTLHSAGWQLLKSYLSIKNTGRLVDAKKYKKIAQYLGLISRRQFVGSLTKKALERDSDFIKLVDLVRLTNVEPLAKTIEEICDHFELPDVWEFSVVAMSIAEVLRRGERQARERISFDFTDMIWLPVKWKLGSQRSFKPYKFVLVDECQDLNAAQLELAMLLAGDSGRMLFVGDPNQAIMGFAGADCNSYQNIVRRVRAIALPLSICYRCPKSHVALVKANFPKIPIEASECAAVGKVVSINKEKLFAQEHDGSVPAKASEALREDDLVLCRKTAPLVSLCIKLISRGIPATVKGKSIGESIKRDLEEIGKMGFPFSQFGEAITSYQAAKLQAYRSKGQL